MMKLMKKGQGLSINTIIIALLAVTVLVVLIMIFTGAMGPIVEKITFFQKGKICDASEFKDIKVIESGQYKGKYGVVRGVLKDVCDIGEISNYNVLNKDGSPTNKICCVPKET